jgi:hypothetical protein
METRKPYGLRSSKRSSLPTPASATTSRKRRRTESSLVEIEQPEAKVARIEAKTAKTETRKQTGKKIAPDIVEVEVEDRQEDGEPSKDDNPHKPNTVEPEPETAKRSEAPEPQGVTVESVLLAIPSTLTQSKSQIPVKSIEGLPNATTVQAASSEWSDLNAQLRVQNLPILENLVRLQSLDINRHQR